MSRLREELRVAEEAHGGQPEALNRARRAAHERLISQQGSLWHTPARQLLAEGLAAFVLTVLFRRIRDVVTGEIVFVEAH